MSSSNARLLLEFNTCRRFGVPPAEAAKCGFKRPSGPADPSVAGVSHFPGFSLSRNAAFAFSERLDAERLPGRPGSRLVDLVVSGPSAGWPDPRASEWGSAVAQSLMKLFAEASDYPPLFAEAALHAPPAVERAVAHFQFVPRVPDRGGFARVSWDAFQRALGSVVLGRDTGDRRLQIYAIGEFVHRYAGAPFGLDRPLGANVIADQLIEISKLGESLAEATAKAAKLEEQLKALKLHADTESHLCMAMLVRGSLLQTELVISYKRQVELEKRIDPRASPSVHKPDGLGRTKDRQATAYGLWRVALEHDALSSVGAAFLRLPASTGLPGVFKGRLRSDGMPDLRLLTPPMRDTLSKKHPHLDLGADGVVRPAGGSADASVSAPPGGAATQPAQPSPDTAGTPPKEP